MSGLSRHLTVVTLSLTPLIFIFAQFIFKFVPLRWSNVKMKCQMWVMSIVQCQFSGSDSRREVSLLAHIPQLPRSPLRSQMERTVGPWFTKKKKHKQVWPQGIRFNDHDPDRMIMCTRTSIGWELHLSGSLYCGFKNKSLPLLLRLCTQSLNLVCVATANDLNSRISPDEMVRFYGWRPLTWRIVDPPIPLSSTDFTSNSIKAQDLG